MESSVILAREMSISTSSGNSPLDFDLENHPSPTGHILSRTAVCGGLTMPSAPVQRMET